MTKSSGLRIVDLHLVLERPEVRRRLRSIHQVDELVAEHQRNGATRVALGVADGEDVLAAVLARTPYAGVCDILALGGAEEHGPALVDAAADHLNAVAVWATIEADDRGRWERFGFSVRPSGPDRARDGSEDGTEVGAGNSRCRFRAERRHPPEPDGFQTAATVTVTDDRRVAVELPPEGNTLPLVPAELRSGPIPAHVLRWILDADEVGLLLQDLAPEIFPPVTPAVRPDTIREALGSLAPVLGHPELDELAPTDDVPGLPEGLHVPVRIVELLAAADRIRTWLVDAGRVRAWAEAEGHGSTPWIVHDLWEPHADVAPELHGRRPYPEARPASSAGPDQKEGTDDR